MDDRRPDGIEDRAEAADRAVQAEGDAPRVDQDSTIAAALPAVDRHQHDGVFRKVLARCPKAMAYLRR